MGKRLLLTALGLALVATACGGVKGHQKYTIQADQQEPAGKKIQYSEFFPGNLTAQAGDTIVFRNRSSEAPHTFTFGVKADRSNSPAPAGPKGLNAAVFQPCFDAGGPSKTLTDCKNPNLPAYDGKGYWNSGVLDPGQGKTAEVKLANDIPDGQYTFVCVLHTAMNGVLTIGKDRKSTADVDKAASDAESKAKSAALDVKAPATQRTAKSVTVSAGWGTPAISYNQFTPLEVTIKAGETVTWADRHPEEPHTVTFASPFKSPDDPRVVAALGVKSGGDYTGGFTNSGFIGGPNTFTLRFPKAGTYSYVCAIHPGMQGTVKVT
jgi:plastocyanin